VIGPVGQAVVASIAAYLVGSLVSSAIAKINRIRRDEGLLGLSAGLGETYYMPREHPSDGWTDLDAIMTIVGGSGYYYAEEPGRSLEDLVRSELDGEIRALAAAIESAKSVNPTGRFRLERRGPGATLVAVLVDEKTREQADFVIPVFNPNDLLAQSAILANRLLEFAPVSGAKVDRLEGEADFRFALAVPLCALIGLFAIAISPFWIPAALIPFALLLQARSLSRDRNTELIAALRARSGVDMEKITPLFKRYREESAQLRQGLEMATWPTEAEEE
jgi:hypothetical protein